MTGVELVPTAVHAARKRGRASGADVRIVSGDVTALRAPDLVLHHRTRIVRIPEAPVLIRYLALLLLGLGLTVAHVRRRSGRAWVAAVGAALAAAAVPTGFSIGPYVAAVAAVVLAIAAWQLHRRAGVVAPR